MKKLLFILPLLITSSWAYAQISPGPGNILYVDQNATGTGEGGSWGNAIPELADALKWAKENEDAGWADSPLQIWVAAGIYKPLYSPRDEANFADEGRDNTFLMVNNVQVFGAFAGGETNFDQRDQAANATILSGDIGIPDNKSDNAYHVVLSSGPVGSARLDGVTITGGNANGSNKILVNGNEINRANGGGMVNFISSPMLTNAIVTDNRTGQDAGGIFNNDASPTLINVVIADNSAMRNGGGMRNYTSSPLLTNVTMNRNNASNGDVMFNDNGSSPVIANSILWSAGGITNVTGSSMTVTYSIIQGRTNSSDGNISAAGLTAADIFKNPSGGDYTLKSYSPALNAGNITAYTNAGGNPNGDVDPMNRSRIIGFNIDMGAYESNSIMPDGDNILYVDQNAAGDGIGSSWSDAIPDLADALKWAKENRNYWSAGSVDSLQIWVAKGTYKPKFGAETILNGGTYLNPAGRGNTFLMVCDVKLYGGFDPPNGITDMHHTRILPISDMDGTILSGDIGVIDDNTDNAYHVVTASGASGTPHLNGFTITAGNANSAFGKNLHGNHINQATGGGIANYNSSLRLTNITVNGNYANAGGGIYNESSSPILIDVVLSENTVTVDGGGMYNSDGSTPSLTNVTVTSNTAMGSGGGMLNWNSSPNFINVSITENTANAGGGMYNYGSNPLIISSTFINNSANDGGAIVNNGSEGVSSPTITNTTFTNNSASNRGGAIYNIGGNAGKSSPVITGSLFTDNTAHSGGAIYNYGENGVSSPSITNTTFTNNNATFRGGSIFNYGNNGESNPVIIGNHFTGNTAHDGGVIYNYGDRGLSSPIITNTAFIDNSASTRGGAISNNGANGGESNPVITGSLFTGNSANKGGALYNDANNGLSSPVITNVTFVNNIANNNGMAILNNGMNGGTSQPAISNSVFYEIGVADEISNENGATPIISYTLIAGNYTGTGNINSAGLAASDIFLNPDAGDYTPNYTGPAFNAGDNSALPADIHDLDGNGNTTEAIPYDLTGSPRVQDGTVDLGAYESTSGPPVVISPIPDIKLIQGDSKTIALNTVFKGADELTYAVTANTNPDLVTASIDHSTSLLTLKRLAGESGNTEITIQAEDTQSRSATDTFIVTIYGSVIYVDSSAVAGANSGFSWENAFTDLQDALSIAPAGGQVWVAAGTYFPTGGTDRTASFQLIDSVAVYGGFIGGETNLEQRDPWANPTILSGDIGEAGNSSDNSYHVIDGSGTNSSALLDGFVVMAGNANVSSGGNHYGGGIYIDSGSPTLSNMAFKDNNAAQRGGGMYTENNSSPTLTNAIFINNSSGGNGGGMTNWDSNPRLRNVIFSGNYSEKRSGGMHNNFSNPTLMNVIFASNSTNGRGGAMSNGNSSPVLRNVTMFGNTASEYAGAIFNNNNSNPELVNGIIWGNSAPTNPGIYNQNDDPAPSYAYSLVQGLNPGGTNLDGTNPANDPLFVNPSNPAGPDNIIGTADDGLQLQPASPAIDAGKTDTTGLGLPASDFTGNERLIGTAVDMGAYEASLRVQITGSEGWRIMTAPDDGISYAELFSDLWLQGMTGADTESGDPNLYTYSEENQQFVAVTDASAVPDAGQGFIIYVYDDQDFDGTADGFPKILKVDKTRNNEPVSATLTYTDDENPATTNDGFNLVGNPYASTINWDAASGWTRNNIDSTFYIWNAEAGQYQSWNGAAGTLTSEGLIAPWQGFWVKANAANPELTFSDKVRSAGGVFYKKKAVPQLAFTLSGTQFSSKAVVMLSEQAQIGKDAWDAYKLASLNGETLSLFTTLEDGRALDINALPLKLEESISIPLSFDGSDLNGDFKLSWLTEALPEDWSFILKDNQTGMELDVLDSTEVDFKLGNAEASKVSKKTSHFSPQHHILSPKVKKSKSSGTARFTLIITSALATINEELANIPQSVELKQNYPNPFNPATTIEYGVPEAAEVTLEVFDMLGRKVTTLLNHENKPAGRYSIHFDASRLASGIYIYRLRTGSKVISKKLTLIK